MATEVDVLAELQKIIERLEGEANALERAGRGLSPDETQRVDLLRGTVSHLREAEKILKAPPGAIAPVLSPPG